VDSRERSLERLERSHRRYLKLRSVLYDRVTGLPAFPILLDRLRSWLDDRRAIGVLYIEVENLGVVESLYGWQVFDRILARVAGELSEAVGTELPDGSLLGLNGVAGDRFAAFVPRQPDGSEVDTSYLVDLGSRLCARLEEAFAGDDFAGLNPRLEFRTGQAQLTLDPFFRFERRVYAALEQARTLERRRASRRERGVGDDLKRIIEESALRTLFQPVVDLRSREIHGYEALSRGPEESAPEMPAALFAASDRLGVAVDLDHACREAALDACAGLEGRAIRGKFFLNGLPASFASASDERDAWPERLRRLADAPQDLVLEFSERRADDDPDGFIDTLGRLKACGFGVAVDDIGTGYASQSILEQLRPDYLKLDVSLVRKIDQNLIKQELLGSLVRIANRIGASVIAEGVETELEARALAEAGAQFGQGYLYARPAASIEGMGGRAP
jgi:EAL domain-containing protein (putative c-di-GMP-specific phosphodiesterase class I)